MGSVELMIIEIAVTFLEGKLAGGHKIFKQYVPPKKALLLPRVSFWEIIGQCYKDICTGVYRKAGQIFHRPKLADTLCCMHAEGHSLASNSDVIDEETGPLHRK